MEKIILSAACLCLLTVAFLIWWWIAKPLRFDFSKWDPDPNDFGLEEEITNSLVYAKNYDS